MRPVVGLLILFCSVYPLDAGRTIRISSPQFSFLLDEPDGWMIDVRSAVQIANFVVYPQGSTWRSAGAAVFGRFVSREDDQTLEDLVKEDELRFQQGCPMVEIKRVDLDWKQVRMHEFLVKSYACMGAPSEIVGITQVPGFFVLFSLSSPKGEGTLSQGIPVLQELMESFRFLPSNSRRTSEAPPPKKP